MRFAAAGICLIALTGAAFAQQAPQGKPAAPSAQTKPAAPAARTDPVAESYSAVPEAERIAIQNDLIWSGDYNGTASGDFGPRAVTAVKSFQKRQGGKETGVLNPKERAELAAAAKKKRDAIGWRVVDDGATGARVGIPAKLVPQHTPIAGGSRWASARGEIQVETFRIGTPGTTLQAIYELQRKVPERKISYNLTRPDFFVISGLQGLKKFYVRGAYKDGQVRGFTILYDQAMEGIVDPVVIGMSSAFTAFPAAAVASGPPPRRKVEYGTGVIISVAGDVVTSRDLLEGCQVITLAGYGPADLVTDDKAADLALLRIYGARNLAPIALAEGPGGSELTLVGIADPQAQGGGSAVSTASARLTAAPTGRPLIEPAPALGFAGAPAFEKSGHPAGIVGHSAQVLAGPSASAAQATLIGATAIKGFLTARHVTLDVAAPTGIEAAKAAVVRVICVRK